MIKKSPRGFTLIELMVVVTIIILLSGVSLSSYFRFSQRQAAKNDARNFSTTLRRVQAMAKNLVYPTGCTGLSGYLFYAAINTQSVSADAVCSGARINVFSGEQVLSTATFSSPISITFEVGSGNASPFGEFPISNSNDDFTVVVKIDRNGVISTTDYEDYP